VSGPLIPQLAVRIPKQHKRLISLSLAKPRYTSEAIFANLRKHALLYYFIALRRGWDCGFEFWRGHGCLPLMSVVCCRVEVSATGRSPVQRSPTKCGIWVWSWSFDNEEALAHYGAVAPWGRIWIELYFVSSSSGPDAPKPWDRFFVPHVLLLN